MANAATLHHRAHQALQGYQLNNPGKKRSSGSSPYKIISIISSPVEVRCEIAEESQETCPIPEDSQSKVKVSNLQLQDDGGSSFDAFDLHS